jgi:hypothetical protein
MRRRWSGRCIRRDRLAGKRHRRRLRARRLRLRPRNLMVFDCAPHETANPTGSSLTGRFPSTPRTIGIELRAPTANSANPVAFRWSLFNRPDARTANAGAQRYSCAADRHDFGNREGSCLHDPWNCNRVSTKGTYNPTLLVCRAGGAENAPSTSLPRSCGPSMPRSSPRVRP